MAIKETVLQQQGEVVLLQVETTGREGTRPVIHFRLTDPDKPPRVTTDRELAMSAYKAAVSRNA